MAKEYPTQAQPFGLSLSMGDVFVARTGPRRVTYTGQRITCQRHGRRYLCLVLSVADEKYLDWLDRSRRRRVMDVEVIGV